MTRSLKNVSEPFIDDAIDRSRWSTKDLFALDLATPMVFPKEACKVETRLRGQEDTERCKTCEGEGQMACATCEGERRVSCHDCHGKGNVICQRCEGEGVHLNVSGKIVDCIICKTAGTVLCVTCTGKGRIACGACEGNGTLGCESCIGQGQLKRYWVLITEIETNCRVCSRMAEPWKIDIALAANDAAVVDRIQYPWPESSHADVACPTLSIAARDMMRATLQEQFAIAKGSGRDSRISGLRVKLAATYIYSVEIEYKDSPGRIFLGGNHNIILASYLPVKRRTVLRTLATRVARSFASEFPDERPKLTPEFVANVRAGYSHVLDTKMLVPSLAEGTPWKYEVSRRGYQIDVASPDSAGRGVSFQLELRSAPAGGLLIGANCVLGRAFRDQYVTLLELNRRMSFGRIAIAPVNGSDGEWLFAVDWRSYESLSPSGYRQILSTMASELSKIRASGLAS
ncbi:MAG: hypothetical protein K8T91_17755 [Planctomycetes bacterium]|nr:hypothetical protein [Planctomycetota bacterium]